MGSRVRPVACEVHVMFVRASGPARSMRLPLAGLRCGGHKPRIVGHNGLHQDRSMAFVPMRGGRVVSRPNCRALSTAVALCIVLL